MGSRTVTTRVLAYGLAVCVAVIDVGPLEAAAQSRRERKARIAEESAKPKSVPGGSTFSVSRPYDTVYDTVLNFLKRGGESIDQASKETGQIVTGMIITGGYSHTGTRILVTLIKDTDTGTTIRVAVTEQRRKKLLQTEPWSDPKVNGQETEHVAEQIKNGISQDRIAR